MGEALRECRHGRPPADNSPQETRGGRRDLSVSVLFGDPELDIVFFHLTLAEIRSAVDHRAVRNAERFDEFFGVAVDLIVKADGSLVIRFAQDHLFQLKKFVNTDESLDILAMAPRFTNFLSWNR